MSFHGKTNAEIQAIIDKTRQTLNEVKASQEQVEGLRRTLRDHESALFGILYQTLAPDRGGPSDPIYEEVGRTCKEAKIWAEKMFVYARYDPSFDYDEDFNRRL